MSSKWKIVGALVALALALALAACGGSGGGSEELADLSATQLAKKAAPNIEVEPRTVGVVNLVRQSPAEDKIDRFYDAVAEALGWNIEIVDGAGNPTKIATAVQTFLNKGVDAVITTSTDAAVIRKQLLEAKSKDIPVISTNGGTTPSSLFTAQYEEDEYKMGKVLADYMKETVDEPKIANLATSIAYSGVLRNKALHDAFPNEVVAESEVDLTNPVVDTQNKLSSMLTAHPDINAVWAVYDNMSQASIKTIQQKNSDAKLYNFFTTPTNVKNLREPTALEAVSDVDLPHTGGVAIEQLLEHFERGAPIDPDALKKNPLTYKVVTRDNLRELVGDRNSLFPNSEILKPFLSQWEEEYPAK